MIEDILIEFIDNFITINQINIRKRVFGENIFYVFGRDAILSIYSKYYHIKNNKPEGLDFNNPNLIEIIKNCLLSYKDV